MFANYSDEIGFDRTTTLLFAGWKADYAGAHNNTWSFRLGMVLKFVSWLEEHGARTETPSI